MSEAIKKAHNPPQVKGMARGAAKAKGKARVARAGRATPHFAAPPKKLVTSAARLLSCAPMLAGIDNDEQYERGLALYDQILEALPDEEEPIKPDGSDDEDALRLLELLLGKSLAAYGASLSPSPEVPGGAPAAILATLLDQYGLTQSDLPEVGSQGVVSELVNGKRDFSVRQIKAIAKRFNIPADYLLA